MNCVICKQATTTLGFATVTLERDQLTVVFKSVPAQVCNVCGEEYVDDDTAARLLTLAEEAVRAGVQVDVREYRSARAA
jgi:YgiT-type zinc finger domain-containing protein